MSISKMDFQSIIPVYEQGYLGAVAAGIGRYSVNVSIKNMLNTKTSSKHRTQNIRVKLNLYTLYTCRPNDVDVISC